MCNIFFHLYEMFDFTAKVYFALMNCFKKILMLWSKSQKESKRIKDRLSFRWKAGLCEFSIEPVFFIDKVTPPPPSYLPSPTAFIRQYTHRAKLTINVPLFKKLRDIIFYWWENHFMSHFEGHFEGAKTFLTP